MPDKAAMLELFAQVRRRIEASDLSVDWQHEIIAALEQQGLPTDKARVALDKLVEARQENLAAMARLLDEMESAASANLEPSERAPDQLFNEGSGKQV